MNTYFWLVRREFWENRAIWLVPLCIGGALTLAASFGRVEFGVNSPGETRALGGMVLFAFGITFFVVMNIYSSWYLLDCLHSERKDRSVLYWKSLPVSDTATVLAKLFTGLIAIPLVYFIAADLTTVLIALILWAKARGGAGRMLWQPDLWLQLQALWVYLIVTTALWYAPFAGWFMAVSAWAKRAVLLWAVLPLCAACLLERWFLGTHAIAGTLEVRLLGYMGAAFSDSPGVAAFRTLDDMAEPAPGSVWTVLHPWGFIANPQVWLGLAVGAALIAGAIQLRWRRTDA
jgi:ABC-2 type transport system permease protein